MNGSADCLGTIIIGLRGRLRIQLIITMVAYNSVILFVVVLVHLTDVARSEHVLISNSNALWERFSSQGIECGGGIFPSRKSYQNLVGGGGIGIVCQAFSGDSVTPFVSLLPSQLRFSM